MSVWDQLLWAFTLVGGILALAVFFTAIIVVVLNRLS